MLNRLLTRILLPAFPRAFRDRLGRPMIQTFLADSRNAQGRVSVPRLVAGAAEVVRAGLSERARVRQAARGGAAPDEARRTVAAVARDLLSAWRALSHRPIFAASVVGTLAVGLGATTAMFSVMDAVLLRPLGFPDDGALVLIGERQRSRNLVGSSLPGLEDYRQFPELTALGAYEDQPLLFSEAEPERVQGVSVSPGFFHTLGVSALLGTVMTPGDPLLDPSPKIVLGYDLWQRQFGSDPNVVGRLLPLESRSYTVIGVMPRGFSFPTGADFWSTLPESMRMVADSRTLRFLKVVARMAPGVGVTAVETRLLEWSARIGRVSESPRDAPGEWTTFATSLREQIVGDVRPGLVAAFAGVCLLLVVACANAATLVLANGRARLRDFAVLGTLGASRTRLARLIVFEGLWLAVAGAGAALLAAAATSHGIVELSTNQIPRIEEVTVGSRVAAFALFAAAVATVMITAAPAWLLTRRVALEPGRQASRTISGSRSGGRVFGALVSIEFALALALTAGAGLLLSSYQRLQAVDNGIAPGRVLTLRVNTPLTRPWTDVVRQRRLYDDLLASVAAAPGVERVAIGARLPFDAVRGGSDMWVSDRPDEKTRALLQSASEGFIAAIGARLVAGRDLAATDTDGAPGVVLVNEDLARALWPDQDPLGRVLNYQYLTGPAQATVIGVVASIRYDGPSSALRPEAYITFRQARMLPPVLVVRAAAADPLLLMPHVKAALATADPTRSVTLDQIQTLDARVARSFARPRFFLVLFGTFGAAAFLLAALGIYGTMTFWVNERWRELGIRLALGATRARVVRLVLTRGLTVASLGLGLGLIATVLGSRMLSTLLFDVTPTDPLSLVGALVSLSAIAVVACVLPARRVSRIDPALTLRD